MNLMELFIKIGVKDDASDKIGSLSSKLGNGIKTAADIGVKAVSAASTAIAVLTATAIKSFAEYEQLAGGAAKIFDEIDQKKILKDANNAYKELGISANQYLAIINDVGATFAATMGDEKGYQTAKTGLKAISDYASGTGKSVDLLSEKFTMITRSTASYQSIADQFSGILPATSADFLEQAQATGILSDSYTQLTEVPIAEYQQAVSAMLEKGVADLGLAGNTAAEAANTISGSLMATKSAWSNLITGLVDNNADFDALMDNFIESATNALNNILPRVEMALSGMGKLIENLMPVVMDRIPEIITKTVPDILNSGAKIVGALASGIINSLETIVQTAYDLIITLANGLVEALPNMTSSIVEIVVNIVDTLTKPKNLSELITAAISIIIALAEGIITALPYLIEKVPVIIANLLASIVVNAPKLIAGGTELIAKLVFGIVQSIARVIAMGFEVVVNFVSGIVSGAGKLVNSGADIINKVKQGITSKISEAKTWGKDLIENFIQGIKDKLQNLKDTVKGVAQSIKDLLGFSEPKLGPLSNFHTYAPDMMQLFAQGIKENEHLVTDQIEKSFDFGRKNVDIGVIGSSSLLGSGVVGGGVSVVQNIYSSAQTAADLMQEAIFQQEKAVYLGV